MFGFLSNVGQAKGLWAWGLGGPAESSQLIWLRINRELGGIHGAQIRKRFAKAVRSTAPETQLAGL